MLTEVDAKSFQQFFPVHPHPFIAASFLDLNSNKVDRLLFLVEDEGKPEIGLVVGVKDNKLLSPFSAPFGGFHFKKENMYSDKLDLFVMDLKSYILLHEYDSFRISLPPDIYHRTFNSKCVSAFYRAGFQNETPEITSYVHLDKFEGRYTQKNSREYYRQALRNKLKFACISDKDEIKEAYELIKENRAKFGRSIYMQLEDINNTANIWPVDFFKVCSAENDMLASAIFYRAHPEIVYAVFGVTMIWEDL